VILLVPALVGKGADRNFFLAGARAEGEGRQAREGRKTKKKSKTDRLPWARGEK